MSAVFPYQPGLAASAEPPLGPIPRIGIALSTVAAVVLFARLIEFAPAFLSSIHPGALLLGGSVLIAVLSGGVARIAGSRVTVLFAAFSVWSATGVVFAVWRGGAARTWMNYWFTSMLAYAAIAALVVTVEQCRRVMYALAGGMLALVTLSFFRASQEYSGQGRYGFDAGTLHNANLLAMIFLLGLPFCLLAVNNWRGVRRAMAAAGTLLIVISVLRTGSRAGLLTLALVALIVFLHASLAGKIRLVLLGSAVTAGAVALASHAALNRFATLLANSDRPPTSAEEASARESTLARAVLLHSSLVKTVEHPVLGVGIGMFMVADSTEALAERRRAMWRVSHNAYTQLSSETGIPGVLLYVAAMVVCFRKLNSIRKATRGVPELLSLDQMAFTLRLALITYAFASFFASTAYECYLPILAALTVAFEPAAWNQIRAYQERARAAVPAAFGALQGPARAAARWAAAR